ncbi:acyl-CoA carboxylase subunit beta [Pseudonocardia alaniniphila]|uniref:Acyl-CoA carboxylase subunit beta n=1 Tax=Pseudonocardia alaniniphila TaxID=75291 RepID=A0ABS9T985_9PSEU|nr:carboxyl transferase domain-containing protein [Pseudonocardia alaniniphila]MCH6165104.1 acyl-CoA carboxylase subunit beta [Pseudonocardia alaniniphila]
MAVTSDVPITVEPDRNHLRPAARLQALLDTGSISLITEDDGVLAVHGHIDGRPVVAFCCDATIKGGALGLGGARVIVGATDTAVERGCPVVGLWHSGGAQLAAGVHSLHGAGEMFAAMTRASGRVLQLSVVLGPAAGAAAYGPALTDVVVLAEQGRIFVTGPEVVRSVTGEQVDMTSLGGPEAHGPRSGVAHILATSEADAIDRARRIVSFVRRPERARAVPSDPDRDPGAHLPARAQRAYDVHPIIRDLLDAPDDPAGFEEFQATWATSVVVGLGRIEGRTVGVVANNPLRKGGCLDSASAEKAARFVRMCDAFGVPLVVLVDVPGYLPGVDQEWNGVVRRGAKLLHAFAEATVPRVTVVLRKAFGGAYIAMNSRALGATAVYAWPQAEVAVMGAEAAVKVLHRKALAAAPDRVRATLLAELVARQVQEAGGVRRAMEIGAVDEVIEPCRTRSMIAAVIRGAAVRSGRHGNIPL